MRCVFQWLKGSRAPHVSLLAHRSRGSGTLTSVIMPELPDDDVDNIKEGTYVYWMNQDRCLGFNWCQQDVQYEYNM